MEKVAIPVSGTRVSPLFDVARTLLLVDLDGGELKNRSRCALTPGLPLQRARFLADLGVTTLVCGGISAPFAMMVQSHSIRLIPWVAGEVEDVAQAHAAGHLAGPQFTMPGCWRRRGRRGRGWGRRGRWNG